ncbi:hypothetical protein CC79DRAFT_754000 [Sarocladium strictum]
MLFSAFSRYLSEDTTSFPDYGTSQDKMHGRLKRMNASGVGPKNTMSRKPGAMSQSTAQAPSQSTPRSIKPRDAHGSLIVEISARPASPSSGLGESDLPNKGRNTPGSSGNTSKMTYSKKSSRLIRPPIKGLNDRKQMNLRNLSIDSVEADATAPSSLSQSRERLKRGASPDRIDVDDLAVDNPSPAKVLSDLTGAKRPRPAHLVSQRQAKRTKAQSPEEPDELQIVHQRRHKRSVKSAEILDDSEGESTSRDDIKSSYFVTPPRLSSKCDHLNSGVLKAAAGNHFFIAAEDQRGPVFLQPKPERPWVLVATDENGRKQDDLAWMDIDLKTGHLSFHPDNRFIQVKRSSSKDHPASVAFQFRYLEDAELVSRRSLSFNQAEQKDDIQLRAIFRKAMKEAIDRKKTIKMDDHQANVSKSRRSDGSVARRRSASPERILGSGSTLRERQRVDGRERQPPFADKDGSPRHSTSHHFGDSEKLQPRRTRRSSPLPLDHNTLRWTEKNPQWANNWKQSLVWPPTGKNRTTVDQADICRLDDGEFLNDNLINFWIRYLQHQLEETDPAMLKRVYFFSTFFFEKLKSNQGKIHYEGVKSWTSKVDIFSYDYLVVPVNENAHWYLAIICNPGKVLSVSSGVNDADEPAATPTRVAAIGKRLSQVRLADGVVPANELATSELLSPTEAGKALSKAGSVETPSPLRPSQDPTKPRIVTLDSLGSAHPKTCSALRQYLAAEAKAKLMQDQINHIPGITAKSIPQQDNWCDCGIYVLAYVEEFLREPNEFLRRILQKEPFSWKVVATEQRKVIRQLIFVLQEQQQKSLEIEMKEKMERRRAKRKDRDLTMSSHSPGSVKDSVENDLTFAPTEAAAVATGQEGAAETSTSPDDVALPQAEPLPQPADRTPASLHVSPAASPRTDGSKNPSSSNSFHTARSSPAPPETTESDATMAPGLGNDRSDILAKGVSKADEDVILIEELTSSPDPMREASVAGSETRKRKRLQKEERMPATPGRRRRLADQMLESHFTAKTKMETVDSGNNQSESGVTYDGIDRKSESD